MPLLPVTAKISYRRVDIQLYDWYRTSFEYFGEICENEGLCICECGRHLLSSSTFMLQKAVAALKHFESSNYNSVARRTNFFEYWKTEFEFTP